MHDVKAASLTLKKVTGAVELAGIRATARTLKISVKGVSLLRPTPTVVRGGLLRHR
jgi:hypothetical protein